MGIFSKSKNLKDLLSSLRKNLNRPEPCIIFHITLLLQPEKSTSRVRNVYDASARGDVQSSNDCLEIGPYTIP